MEKSFPAVKRLSAVRLLSNLVQILKEKGLTVAEESHWKKEQPLPKDTVYLGRVVEIDEVVRKSARDIGHSQHHCLTCRIVPVTKMRKKLGVFRVVLFGDIVSNFVDAQVSVGSIIVLFNPLIVKNLLNQRSCVMSSENCSVWICDVLETSIQGGENSSGAMEGNSEVTESEKETKKSDFGDNSCRKLSTGIGSLMDCSEEDVLSLKLSIPEECAKETSTDPAERLCQCTSHKCSHSSQPGPCACVHKNIVCCCSGNNGSCCRCKLTPFPVGLQCCCIPKIHYKCCFPHSCHNQHQHQCQCHYQHSHCSSCCVRHSPCPGTSPKPNADELCSRISPNCESHCSNTEDRLEFESNKRKKQCDELPLRSSKRQNCDLDHDSVIDDRLSVVQGSEESDAEMEMVYPTPEKRPKNIEEPENSVNKIQDFNCKVKKCLVRIEQLNKVFSTPGIKMVPTETIKLKNIEDKFQKVGNKRDNEPVETVTYKPPLISEVKKDYSSNCSSEKDNVELGSTWQSSVAVEQDLQERKKDLDVKNVVDDHPLPEEKEVIVHRFKFFIKPAPNPKELEPSHSQNSAITDQKKFKKVTKSVTNQHSEASSHQNIENMNGTEHSDIVDSSLLSDYIQVAKTNCETEINHSNDLSKSSSDPAVQTQIVSDLSGDTKNNISKDTKMKNLIEESSENEKEIVSNDQGKDSQVHAESQFSDYSILTQENILIMSPLDPIQMDNSNDVNINERDSNLDVENVNSNELNLTIPIGQSCSVTSPEKEKLAEDSSVTTNAKHSESRVKSQNTSNSCQFIDGDKFQSDVVTTVTKTKENSSYLFEQVSKDVCVSKEECYLDKRKFGRNFYFGNLNSFEINMISHKAQDTASSNFTFAAKHSQSTNSSQNIHESDNSRQSQATDGFVKANEIGPVPEDVDLLQSGQSSEDVNSNKEECNECNLNEENLNSNELNVIGHIAQKQELTMDSNVTSALKHSESEDSSQNIDKSGLTLHSQVTDGFVKAKDIGPDTSGQISDVNSNKEECYLDEKNLNSCELNMISHEAQKQELTEGSNMTSTVKHSESKDASWNVDESDIGPQSRVTDVFGKAKGPDTSEQIPEDVNSNNEECNLHEDNANSNELNMVSHKAQKDELTENSNVTSAVKYSESKDSSQNTHNSGFSLQLQVTDSFVTAKEIGPVTSGQISNDVNINKEECNLDEDNSNSNELNVISHKAQEQELTEGSNVTSAVKHSESKDDSWNVHKSDIGPQSRVTDVFEKAKGIGPDTSGQIPEDVNCSKEECNLNDVKHSESKDAFRNIHESGISLQSRVADFFLKAKEIGPDISGQSSVDVNSNKKKCNLDERNLSRDELNAFNHKAQKQELTKGSFDTSAVKHSEFKDASRNIRESDISLQSRVADFFLKAKVIGQVLENRNGNKKLDFKNQFESDKTKLDPSKKPEIPEKNSEWRWKPINIRLEKCSQALRRAEGMGVDPPDINNYSHHSNKTSVIENGFDRSSDDSDHTQVTDIPNNHYMSDENSENDQSIGDYEPDLMNHVNSEDSLLESPEEADSSLSVEEEDEICNSDINLNDESDQVDEELEQSPAASEDDNSEGSVSDLSVDLSNGSDHKLYTLAAFVKGLEPEMMSDKPFDLVSGHCPGCQRFIPYSQLLSPENSSRLTRHCTVCSEQGNIVQCKLVYFFTIQGVDETGSVTSILISRKEAESIVGAPIEVYLSCRELALALWGKVENYFTEKEKAKEKFHIPVIIRKLRTGLVVMLSGEIEPASSS